MCLHPVISAWITSVMLLERRPCQETLQVSHYPFWFSILTCMLFFRLRLRAFHSFCALLITPLSARITVGPGDERSTKQEDRCSHRFSLRLNGERQEHIHRSLLLVFSPFELLWRWFMLLCSGRASVTMQGVQIGTCTLFPFFKGRVL